MIVRTLPELQYVINQLERSRDEEGVRCFSFDTETRDKGHRDLHIVGCSVAWFADDSGNNIGGAYIPVGHTTGELQLPPEVIFDHLGPLLEDPEVEVVMQNAKYDIKVAAIWPDEDFARAQRAAASRAIGTLGVANTVAVPGATVPVFGPKGIRIAENIFDTMTASFLNNTNGVGSYMQVLLGSGSHGLKDQSKYLLGHEMTELTDLAKKRKELNFRGAEVEVLCVDEVPINDVLDADGKVVTKGLGDYAWDDAVRTLMLRQLHKRKLQADGRVWKIFREMEREFAFVLAEMEMWGVELDLKLLGEMRVVVGDEMDVVREKMFGLRPGQDFDRLVDPQMLEKVIDRWEEYERCFALPQDHPEHPKTVKQVGKGRGKARVVEDVVVPWNKAAARKELLKSAGLEGHPVCLKIRDKALRPMVRKFPHLAHKVFNANSIDQLNNILFEEAGLPPLGEKGANGLFSVDADNVEYWANVMKNPFAKELMRYNKIAKLYGTYLVGMAMKTDSDDRVRTRFGRVRTGRLSSSDPNLQNIPTSSEFTIRRAFVATGITCCVVTVVEWHLDPDTGEQLRPNHIIVEAMPGNPKGWHGGYEVKDGWVLKWWGENPPAVMFVGDYSQLEICLLAHCSGDAILVKAVREGQDIHALTAQAVFDEIPKDISLSEVKKRFKKLRKDAKPVNFGVIYGMGPQKLAGTLGVSVEVAKDIINNRYMGFYLGVAQWIKEMHKHARQHGEVRTAIGRPRHLPAAQLDENDKKWRSLVFGAERQAQNTPIQGLAADVCELAMRDIRRFFKATRLDPNNPAMVMPGMNGETIKPISASGHFDQWWSADSDVLWGNFVRMLLQVHDEIVGESHPATANYYRAEMVRMMEHAGGLGPKLRVPLKVDAALGANWYDTKE